ncbi:MAG: DNA-binding protein [Kofleriaceae bacterium]|nr:DNA-binding protein [Kofleriaceae bacterium]MCB9571675.1 DNA-binding protein [Kofleriaceae bacterium]
MTNERIAHTLEEIATLLEQQDASPHRVRAWRAGAQAARAHPRELGDVFHDHGRVGLEAIPHIGVHLSAIIIELLRSGHVRLLDRLRGEVTPEAVFARLPGIGDELAARIHHELGVETLEELEVAAHDGRLAAVEGFGPRRVEAVRDLLDARLARARRHGVLAHGPRHAPPVALLLDVDRRYRDGAAAGTLRTIAPRRFNPGGEAWLPLLHDDRDGWSLTALYSNTALAHQLGRTRDWVVIYAARDGEEDRATVVTETRGPLRGRRVVRGREDECAAWYGTAGGPGGAQIP